MNHIKAEEHRNLQTRLVHCDVLELIRARDAAHVQGRAEQALADEVQVFGAKVAVPLAVELLELPQLLFERHARQERVDSSFDVGLPVLCGDRQDGQKERESQEQAR